MVSKLICLFMERDHRIMQALFCKSRGFPFGYLLLMVFWWWLVLESKIGFARLPLLTDFHHDRCH